LAVIGCGGGGDSQAVSDCNSFVSNHYCPKVVACEPAGYITTSECVSAVDSASGLPCASVVSENGQLGACENQVDSESCADFIYTDGTITLPSTCQGVFTTNN
jgi:hypothetical protein